MDVSVVICTHNSGPIIGRTLRSLRAQSMDRHIRWEVIVVDYESTDDTVGSCRREWAGCDIDLSIIAETRPGKSPALEAGIYAARGVAVCLVDDDNLVDPNYIQAAHRVMSRYPDVGLIGAHGKPLPETQPPEWFEFYSGVYAVGHQAQLAGYVEPGAGMSFWGAGSVIRKAAWSSVKATGFNLILNPSREGAGRTFRRGFTGGEDQEISFVLQHAGYRLWYEPSLIFHHYVAKERLTKSYLYRTTDGTARAIPVLKLYMSAFPPMDLRQRLRVHLYRCLPLMLAHEVLGAVVGILRAGRSRFVLIDATRAILRLRGCVLGVWDLRGRSAWVLDQVRVVRSSPINPSRTEIVVSSVRTQ